MNKKPTVAIIYGFAEGRFIAKKFIHRAQEMGLKVITDPKRADFIIAHSGGIYLIPTNHNAKLIILDAPSIGDTDTWKNIQIKKAKLDYVHARETHRRIRWFYKSFLNIFYLLFKLSSELKMLGEYLRHKHTLPIITGSQVIVIMHKNDPWSTKISNDEKANHRDYTFINHTGVHDDLWINPEYYIGLLL